MKCFVCDRCYKALPIKYGNYTGIRIQFIEEVVSVDASETVKELTYKKQHDPIIVCSTCNDIIKRSFKSRKRRTKEELRKGV